MPTNITQITDAARGKTILRVAGSLTHEDAVLLEKIALDMRAQTGRNLTLDLSDLHFIDSESAPVIKRLERIHRFEIEGIEYFLQKIVDETENRHKQ